MSARPQFHHQRLVHDISSLNGSYRQIQEGFLQQLMRRGAVAPNTMVSVVMNSRLTRQATIMAYNDIFMLMVWLFVVALCLIPLLPTRPPHLSGDVAAH